MQQILSNIKYGGHVLLFAVPIATVGNQKPRIGYQFLKMATITVEPCPR